MVSDSTLSVDVWNAIKNVLVAASLQVTDGTSVISASVRSAYNDETPVRPQIVISPIKYDESGWKFGSSEGHKLININIDCYYKKTLGVDQLFDGVASILKATEIQGVELVGITSDYTFSQGGENKFHLKNGVFTYDRE